MIKTVDYLERKSKALIFISEILVAIFVCVFLVLVPSAAPPGDSFPLHFYLLILGFAIFIAIVLPWGIIEEEKKFREINEKWREFSRYIRCKFSPGGFIFFPNIKGSYRGHEIFIGWGTVGRVRVGRQSARVGAPKLEVKLSRGKGFSLKLTPRGAEIGNKLEDLFEVKTNDESFSKQIFHPLSERLVKLKKAMHEVGIEGGKKVYFQTWAATSPLDIAQSPNHVQHFRSILDLTVDLAERVEATFP